MMPMADKPVIIIRKRAAHHRGHHGGAWKVAYADFVTAMMAFFLVMWIVGQSKQTKDTFAQYFRDPGAFDTSQGRGLMPGTEGTPAEVPKPNASLEQTASQIRKALEAMPKFNALSDRIKIEMAADGLHIELLDRAKDSFFDSGSAELKPEMLALLKVIAGELSVLPHKVAIEGYSDSRMYRPGQDYDNWTLSADRANAARRVMEKGGLGAAQVDAVRGYANTRLRYPKDPLDPRNRRITIVVTQ